MKQIALLIALVPVIVAEVNKPLFDDVIIAAQGQIRPALGPEKNQCFTAEDKTQFDKDHRAMAIASDVANSANFSAALKLLCAQSKARQQQILSHLLTLRQRTVAENGGVWGRDSQTDAGAEAQTEIARQIVEEIRKGLISCKR